MLCRECGAREARYRAPDGKYRRDDQHDLCGQCYRSSCDRMRALNDQAHEQLVMPILPAIKPEPPPEWPTASKLDLAQECLYPWMPGVKRRGRGGAAAALGQAFHKVASDVIEQRVGPEVEFDPAYLPEIAASFNLSEDQFELLSRMTDGWRAWWAEQKPVRPRAEVAFAYNVDRDTARVLARGAHHRDYSDRRAGEFVGTADLVTDGPPLVVNVTDWKCGQRQYVRKPAENPQLRLLALAATRAYGVEGAHVELGWIDPDGGVDIEAADFGTFELAAIAGEALELARRLESGQEQPTPGPHCPNCESVADCPRSHAALIELVKADPPEAFHVVAEPAAISSPEHASWLLHRLRAVRAAAQVVEDALRMYSDEHDGIATGDGAVWKRKEVHVPGVHLNAEGKAQLDARLPGAVEYTASQRSITDAARAAKLPLKRTKDEVMALLKALGAVTTQVVVKYEDS